MLYYSLSKKKFAIIPFQKTFIDHQEVKVFDNMKALYEELKTATTLKVFDKYEENSVFLENFS